jgi:hypothetical protein
MRIFVWNCAMALNKKWKARLRDAVLVTLASVALQGCQDTKWRGVVDTGPLKGEPAYRVDKGTFATFADCERAMKADMGETTPREPVPQGYVNRKFTLKCVQGNAVIEIGTEYNLPRMDPK